MAFFSNTAVNRLALHFTLHQSAWSISGIFFAVFLIRAGFSPAGVFLVLAAMLVVRLALRPLVLAVVAAIGLRQTLILGAVLCVPQILSLAAVHGAVDIELIIYILATGVADVFYWTCYHAAFAQLGDAENRGSQVSARGFLSTLAGVAGPVIGGGMLAVASPWAAFGVGAVIALASVLPLLKIPEVPVVTTAAGHSFKAVRAGVILFSTDGFITCGSWVTWDIITFASLDQRYDAFGGLLGAAALAGAIGGMVLGRLIDAGHTRRAVAERRRHRRAPGPESAVRRLADRGRGLHARRHGAGRHLSTDPHDRDLQRGQGLAVRVPVSLRGRRRLGRRRDGRLPRRGCRVGGRRAAPHHSPVRARRGRGAGPLVAPAL
jgi:MFS transporter, DHA1 family, inner membrane transport protein